MCFNLKTQYHLRPDAELRSSTQFRIFHTDSRCVNCTQHHELQLTYINYSPLGNLHIDIATVVLYNDNNII